MMLGFIHIHRLGSKSGPSLSELGSSTIRSFYLARFCSAKGRCDVVNARKDSFSMSQSSNP